MAIASRLKHHLDAKGLPFDMLAHPYTATASETAEQAHIPGDHLAKSVLIHMEETPFVAVVPSHMMVDLHMLQSIMDRRLGLAPEGEVAEVFEDCEIGAAPPVGVAYGVPTIIDRQMMGLDDVWFEAGDHRTLVHMKGRHFDRLMGDAKTGSFCCLH
jgi:Ala-tRNA(Pro) deacylase